MKVFENLPILIFAVICFGLACYETYKQFREYIRNEDTASIEYRNFNLEEKDQYPTFSICFRSLQFGENFDAGHPSFTSYNITPSLYGWFLMGYEDDDPKYDQIVYDDVSATILHNYVTRFDSLGTNGSHFLSFTDNTGNENRNENPFSITVQQPLSGDFKTCYSKKISYHKEIIQIVDEITFNATSLSQKEFEMMVYIHQKGQAIQALMRAPVLHIITSDVSKLQQEYEFRIDKVEVLRKRYDSRVRCDESLLDETKIIRTEVMRKVGCIPAYWQIFVDDLQQKLPKCKQNQYGTIHTEYFKFPALNAVESMYTQPCSIMTLSATLSAGETGKVESDFQFAFRYDQKYYKAIINTRAYTSGTLLGQIGGYVGKQ